MSAEQVTWQLVPKEPVPEMLAAWYRYKNGHHFPGEPEPRDTSDYGAYRAMLAAAPNRQPDPSKAFSDWLTEGPKLAKAAGCYVGIKVTAKEYPAALSASKPVEER